jgi:hypothetical protein
MKLGKWATTVLSVPGTLVAKEEKNGFNHVTVRKNRD